VHAIACRGRVKRSVTTTLADKMKNKLLVLIVLLLVASAVATSFYIQHHKKYSCYKTLRQINEAKWAASSAEHYSYRTVIPAAMLINCMKVHALPKCPSGGEYSIGSVGDLPTCSVHDNLFNKYATSEDACINNLRIIDAGVAK
jgi:hypothetical protein